MTGNGKSSEALVDGNTMGVPSVVNQEVREAVRFLYDLQRVRLQVGGRPIQGQAGKKVDLKPGDMGYISQLHGKLKELEVGAEKHVTAALKSHIMWDWLSAIRGMGPRMAGVLLSEVDINRAPTVSSLWRHAGCAPVPAADEEEAYRVLVASLGGLEAEIAARLGVAVQEYRSFSSSAPSALEDVQAKDLWAAYLEKREQLGRITMVAERPRKGEKLKYNKFLKTKLLGVMADNFLMLNSPYRRFYDEYKHRKDSAGWGKSKGHRHNAAKRYMVKMFLQDFWVEWRTRANLPVRVPYSNEYLGKVHQGKSNGVTGE
jgi:hypothetical protein